MRNLTPASITQAFADYAKNAPSERTRTLLVSLAGHLHSFVRDNKVTQAEWGAAIDALTRAKLQDELLEATVKALAMILSRLPGNAPEVGAELRDLLFDHKKLIDRAQPL